MSLFYYHYLNEPIMTHNLYSKREPLYFMSFIGTVVPDPDKNDYIIDTTFQSDYLLIKSGRKVDDSITEINTKTLKALIKLIDDDFNIKAYYQKIGTFYIFQDKSEVTVYKKWQEVPEEVKNELKLQYAEILKEKRN